MSGSAMSRALCISEILDLVFGFCTAGTQAASSQVCKTWLKPALTHLWEFIDRPYVLFQLLASFKRRPDVNDNDYFPPHGTTILEFTRSICDSDWLRFDFYAPYIRRISFEKGDDFCFHDHVWAEVARTRPRIILLPNVREIFWSTYPWKYAIIFMHPGVRNVGMDFIEVVNHLTTDVIRDLASRCPNITNLSLINIGPCRPDEVNMVDTITSFQHLESLTLPVYFCRPELILPLSRLHSLRDLRWKCHRQQRQMFLSFWDRYLSPWNMSSFCETLPEEAFPSLRELDLRIDLDAATTFISHPKFSAPLSVIDIHIIRRIVDPHAIYSFLQACRKFSSLTAIYLNLYPLMPSTQHEDFTITNAMLNLAMACPNLTRFHLESPNASAVTQDKLEAIAEALPHLVTFVLCQCPPYETPSPLNLVCIIPFFRFCPNINSIGLYIDGNVPVEITEDISIAPFKRFTLHVGTSPLTEGDNAGRVTDFLSQLQTKSGVPITLRSGLVWERFTVGHNTDEPYQESKKAWKGVSEQLRNLWFVNQSDEILE